MLMKPDYGPARGGRDISTPDSAWPAIALLVAYLTVVGIVAGAGGAIYTAASNLLGGFIVPLSVALVVGGFVPFCWLYAKLGGR